MSATVQTNNAVHLRLLDTEVTIESPDARWIGVVRRLWSPFVWARNRRPLRVVIEPNASGWRVRFPDRTTPPLPDPWSLIANLAQELDARAFAEASGIQDVHAAVVALEGNALLLAGPSGASKTSIALELLRLGWVYLSDDRAPIRRGTGMVMPFPKPPGIKDADKWPRYRALWDGDGWPPPPTGWFHVPASAVGPVAEEDATPRFVVFPRFESGADLEFEELSAGRATALASQYVMVLTPDAVRVLARLSRETRAASLVHGDSRAAAKLIDRWVKTG